MLTLAAGGQLRAQPYDMHNTCTPVTPNVSGTQPVQIGVHIAEPTSDRLIGQWLRWDGPTWECPPHRPPQHNSSAGSSLGNQVKVEARSAGNAVKIHTTWAPEGKVTLASRDTGTSGATVFVYQIPGQPDFGYLGFWYVNTGPGNGRSLSASYDEFNVGGARNDGETFSVSVHVWVRLIWLGTGSPPAVQPLNFPAVEAKLRTQRANIVASGQGGFIFADDGYDEYGPVTFIPTFTIDSTPASCTTPADTVISFGAIKLQDFSGIDSTAGPQRVFEIALTNCPRWIRDIHWSLNGNVHISAPNRLALDDSSTASGIAIEFTGAGRTVLQPGETVFNIWRRIQWYPTPGQPPNPDLEFDSTQTIPFRARVVQTEAVIGPGEFTATATLVINYQ